jgi:hypothetical protein
MSCEDQLMYDNLDITLEFSNILKVVVSPETVECSR